MGPEVGQRPYDLVCEAIRRCAGQPAEVVSTAVFGVLTALPVTERMWAMGMTRGFCTDDGRGDEDGIGGGYEWVPDDSGDCWRERGTI